MKFFDLLTSQDRQLLGRAVAMAAPDDYRAIKVCAMSILDITVRIFQDAEYLGAVDRLGRAVLARDGSDVVNLRGFALTQTCESTCSIERPEQYTVKSADLWGAISLSGLLICRHLSGDRVVVAKAQRLALSIVEAPHGWASARNRIKAVGVRRHIHAALAMLANGELYVIVNTATQLGSYYTPFAMPKKDMFRTHGFSPVIV